jgi:hypothetical protein
MMPELQLDAMAGLGAADCSAAGRILKARELEISPCELAQIRRFVETHHYSHNLNGVKISHCFRVEYEGKLVGGVVFGALSTTAWKRFADSEEKVMELRRLVLLDEAGRNSESRVVGWCLRWLKKHAPEIEVMVSYADPAHGHSGVIYRASNFQHVGMSAADKGFRDPETGKTYHSRALRTKYNGDFKPFVKKLRAKHEAGLLEVVELPGKHCYTYAMKAKRQNVSDQTREEEAS